MANNPYINPTNYLEGYNESIKKLKEDSATVHFDKLCYELFEHNETGKKFIEYITKHVLLRPSGDITSPLFANAVTYGEGYKAAYLCIIASVESHSQRIKAETNANDSSITK